MNPAVTLAYCLTGHTSWGRGGLYMLAQLLGAIFGALIEARPTHCKSLNYADSASNLRQGLRMLCYLSIAQLWTHSDILKRRSPLAC